MVSKSRPTLLQPHGYSPPGSSVWQISQARTLEWAAISLSMGSSRPRDQTQVSCVAGGFFTIEPPGKPVYILCMYTYVCMCTHRCTYTHTYICLCMRERHLIWLLKVKYAHTCLLPHQSQQQKCSNLPRGISDKFPEEADSQ